MWEHVGACGPFTCDEVDQVVVCVAEACLRGQCLDLAGGLQPGLWEGSAELVRGAAQYSGCLHKVYWHVHCAGWLCSG
jgi:hypothetical protein